MSTELQYGHIVARHRL